jgi:predicted CoA-binding protein
MPQHTGSLSANRGGSRTIGQGHPALPPERPMSLARDPIERFLASPAFGVAGASARRQKFGNKVLRCYQQAGRRAVPVNPREREIEGAACVASVLELPDEVRSLSVITSPAVTERVVEEAIRRGIEHVWMQPGAESPAAVAACRAAGINVIADGSCLLVVLGFQDR